MKAAGADSASARGRMKGADDALFAQNAYENPPKERTRVTIDHKLECRMYGR